MPAKDNPKHIRAMKDGKAPLEYLTTSSDEGDAWVLQGGGIKYGIRNWTIDKILARTYIAAMRRHLKEWADGIDVDKDSKQHPLHHVRACCAIVIDALKHGKLIDDRLFAESISQEAEKDTDAQEEQKLFWTVRYTSVHRTALDIPLSRSKCYGPFYGFEEAKEFATTNPHNQPGIASIDALLNI